MIMKEVRQLLRFNVDIVNHCNLNCVGCGHFSPLAKEYYLPLDSFKRDCEQLSKLTGGVIERMEIMAFSLTNNQPHFLKHVADMGFQ